MSKHLKTEKDIEEIKDQLFRDLLDDPKGIQMWLVDPAYYLYKKGFTLDPEFENSIRYKGIHRNNHDREDLINTIENQGRIPFFEETDIKIKGIGKDGRPISSKDEDNNEKSILLKFKPNEAKSMIKLAMNSKIIRNKLKESINLTQHKPNLSRSPQLGDENKNDN